MSETESDSTGAMRRIVLAEKLASNFTKLPEADQNLFTHGAFFLAANGALSGLMSNVFFRRALNVTQGAISSSLPLAAIPFCTSLTLYNCVVSYPLLSGDLNCPTCVLTRGALAGLVGSGLYPILLALPINMGLAVRYNTAPQPVKGHTLQHCMELTRPVLRKMRLALSMQLLFGTYLSSRHFDIYLKLREITVRADSEELKD